ncbi:MAG: hypothetical protein RJB13_646 [Pseudomonadota bacterium]
MITNSRLTQPALSKIENDPFRSSLTGEGVQSGNELPTDSLLSGGNLMAGGSSFGKTNTFDQLLQLANIDKDKGQKSAQSRKPNDDNEVAKTDDRKTQEKSSTKEKKSAKDNNSARTQSKSKNEKKGENDSAELAQLLAYQKPVTMLTDTVQADSSKMKSDLQKVGNPLQFATANAEKVSQSQTPLDPLNQSGNSLKNIEETLKNLDKEGVILERNVGLAATDTKSRDLATGKADELKELTSKFDSVQMDFTSPNQQAGVQSQLAQAQLEKAQLTKENLLKMMQQDMIEGDAAFRDFLKMSAAQTALTETQAAEKLALLSQIKSEQLEQLNLNGITQDALLAQQQLRELRNGQPSQWKSLDELSPNQVAMLETLSGANSTSNAQMSKGFVQSIPESVQSRLIGQENEQSKGMNSTQIGIDSQPMFTNMNNDGGASSSFSRNNSSFSGNSSRGEPSPIGQSTSGKLTDLDLGEQEKTQQSKADARTRESERTREMARAAAQRAQTIAAELATKGGGTARVQIKDSQLGVVELRINMSDNNRMNVQLVANSDRIKQELEKHADALKDGLEKHQLIVEGVNFATDMKLGESSFQSNTQSENQSQQQSQAQNQQGFSSFQQGNSGQGQGNFEQERFFEQQQFAGLGNQIPQKNSRQNYAGKNDSQTNIQRSANGSLKVSA